MGVLAERMFAGGGERQIMEDANGVPRYVDTGQPVFPGVEAAAPSAAVAPEDMATYVGGMADDIRADRSIRNYEDALVQYESMQRLAARGTSTDDVALVFAFFKTIDPTSTVREGEYAQAANSMGLADWLVQEIERVDTGERLPEQVRQYLVSSVRPFLEGHHQRYLSAVNGYLARAEAFGVDPALLFPEGPRSLPEDRPTATAAAGGPPIAPPNDRPASLDDIYDRYGVPR